MFKILLKNIEKYMILYRINHKDINDFLPLRLNESV